MTHIRWHGTSAYVNAMAQPKASKSTNHSLNSTNPSPKFLTKITQFFTDLFFKKKDDVIDDVVADSKAWGDYDIKTVIASKTVTASPSSPSTASPSTAKNSPPPSVHSYTSFASVNPQLELLNGDEDRAPVFRARTDEDFFKLSSEDFFKLSKPSIREVELNT